MPRGVRRTDAPLGSFVKYALTFDDGSGKPIELLLSRGEVPGVINGTWAGRVLNLPGFKAAELVTESGTLKIVAQSVIPEAKGETPKLGVFSR